MRDELYQLLQRVFPLFPVPENVRNGGQKDDLQVEAAFKGMPWDQITWERIRSYCTFGAPEEAFWLLTSEGKRYYLPAQLTLYLKDEEALLWTEPLCSILTRQTSRDQQRDYFDDAFELCTSEQKEVVARCLLFFGGAYKDYWLLSENDALTAYHSYWVRFDPNPEPPVAAPTEQR